MEDARFDVEVVDDSTAVIVAEGELDLSNVALLEECVEHARRDGRKRLVVDLSEVTHMDSTVLAKLIGAHQSAAPAGAVVLVVPEGMIRRTLEVRGLDAVFRVASSREAALRELAGGSA